jgi:hypothetical protein
MMEFPKLPQPISPSNLELFIACPLLYKATYVTKEFKRPSNKYLERGLRLHKLLELSVNGKDAPWPTEELAVRERIWKRVELFRKLRAAGSAVRTEVEAAVDREGNPVSWWNERCYMRSKLDVVFTPGAHLSTKYDSLIVDWKPGKRKADAGIQLLINCLCLGAGRYNVMFIYVDRGKEDENIFVTRANDVPMLRHDMGEPPEGADPLRAALPKLAKATRALDEAVITGSFPPNYDGGQCRFCEWRGCQ